MKKIEDIIVEIGSRLEFEAVKEVEASGSAWIDVVWFDKSIPISSLGVKKPDLRKHPVLPVVGFEIEKKTANDAKHIKGSISNLEVLGAPLGVIVIGQDNLKIWRKQADKYKNLSDTELEEKILKRLRKWKDEVRPRCRIVIMLEKDIIEWTNRLGVKI